MTIATTGRVLRQLRGDRRTVALMLVVPSAMLFLVNRMLDTQVSFNQTALSLLGIFPFTTMFLITSVAMLRERTSGTLERLFTTQISKLDLLLGYGIAFSIAAAAQAAVTCATAYFLLNLYTPGNPLLVSLVAITSAVMGMALGLLCSAFAATEFQAVQFMPALVTPQILLGGLFVPRTQMADWLYNLSAALPMTYDIEALSELGKTSLITAKLVRDTGVMIGVIAVTLTLAAATLRRRTGAASRRARMGITLGCTAVLACAGVLIGSYLLTSSGYVSTENAQIDGDQIPIVAPTSGIVTDWQVTEGSALRRNRVIGHLRNDTALPPVERVIRAPSDGTVVSSAVVPGTFVRAGTQLAVAYQLSAVYVTARVKETNVDAVHAGERVDINVDAFPGQSLTGVVQDVQITTAGWLAPLTLPDSTTGSFQKVIQVIPVRIAILDRQGQYLVPGMNVTVRIHTAQ